MTGLSMTPSNPYVYGMPISEESAFFGRKKELQEIIYAVARPIKQDIYVIGGRRAGKTSLLYQLEKLLDRPFLPVYIPLTFAEPETKSVLKLILSRITMRLIDWGVLDEHFQNKYVFTDIDFEDSLAEIIQRAQKRIPKIRIVLLLDETDYLLEVGPRIQHILRAALQSPYLGDSLSMVMAAVTDLSAQISQYTSPLFNHFRSIILKPLSEEETRKLILEPASAEGFEYSLDATERIMWLSGRQPYYCQVLCYEAFGYALKMEHRFIDGEEVSFAEKETVEKFLDVYRTNFWERASLQERKFLTLLAQHRSVRHITRDRIAQLLDWQIIEESEARRTYSFSAGLFEIWTAMLSKRG